ncbi:hypothetical protein FKM82_011650 [Ascaphus truei]
MFQNVTNNNIKEYPVAHLTPEEATGHCCETRRFFSGCLLEHQKTSGDASLSSHRDSVTSPGSTRDAAPRWEGGAVEKKHQPCLTEVTGDQALNAVVCSFVISNAQSS